MSDINVRSDAVDVEQIMRQIRARIREKRGADYTEAELQQLAHVKLEKFLDPRGVRSDLVAQYRRTREASPASPNFAFGEDSLFETHRGLLRTIRRLLRPILKLFFNPDKLTSALHIQSQVNTLAETRLRRIEDHDALSYELMHNLTLEVTRLGIEAHNLKMRVESLSSRLEFDERRGRSLEGVVQYRSNALQRPASGDEAPVRETGSPASPGGPGASEHPGQGSGERRRRRRRRRRRPGQTMADGQTQAPLAHADAAREQDGGDDGPDDETGTGDGPDSSDDDQ
jgi:hypothetical protein